MTNLLVMVLFTVILPQAERTPAAAVDELLAADRQFAAAASKLDAAAAMSAMFADDVAMMPVPPEGFARGRAKAVDALGANPVLAKARAEWAPVRGGISADGLHGFTLGYMTLTLPDAPARR